MRILKSWPMATLLLGIAALMSLNAANGRFSAAPSYVDHPNPHADELEATGESHFADRSVVQASASVPTVPTWTESATSQDSNDQTAAYGSLEPSPGFDVSFTDEKSAETELAESSEPYIGWAASEVKQEGEPVVWSTSKPSEFAGVTQVAEVGNVWVAAEPDSQVSCTKCEQCRQGKHCTATGTGVYVWGKACPGKHCTSQACQVQTCPAKGACPNQDSKATQQVADARTAVAITSSGQCQELSSVTPGPNVATYQFRPTPTIQEGLVVSGWLERPQPQRPDPYASFGAQAGLIRHLVEVHEQLGELRGEASLRESVISVAAENAAMSAQLEAMQGHHNLMEKLVQQTIELERLRAGQEATQLASAKQQSSEDEAAVLDATAQQARLDDVRRENAQLRRELDGIRSQLQAITQSAEEPQAATANRNPYPANQ